jgi:acyl dehydratase
MKTKASRQLLVFISVIFLCCGLLGSLLRAFGPYGVTTEFKTVKPGVYDETEKKVIEEIKKVLSGNKQELSEKIKAQANGKKFYVGAEVQSHQVEFNSAWTPIAYYTPGTNDLITAAKDFTPRNRLYLDPEYAAKSRYGGLVAAPFAVDIAVGLPYTPKLSDAYVWVPNEGAESLGGLDHEVVFYKPIYATDTLTSYITRQDMVDVTPAKGSEYRVFRVIGEGEMYNAKGEKVMSISHTAIEMLEVFKDPSDSAKFEGKVPSNATVRLLKDWSKVRPAHVYTDADWETIKGIWRKEVVRGANTLYWEDVKVGDEPAWTCDGPVAELTRSGGGSPGGMNTVTVRDVLMNTIPIDNSPMGPPMASKVELIKDANGIYQVKAGEMPGGGMPPMSTGAKQPNQRSVFQNTEGRKCAVRMVTNWMGDNGFLYKLAWRVVNDTDHNKFPETFDRPSYLLKVPYLKAQGKFASTHGYAGDVGITKGYVCDKYVKDGKHYVDLVVWSETIEGYIWSECYAVVELPTKN